VAQAVEPIAEGPGPEGAPLGAPRQTGELEPLAVTAERVQKRQPKEEAVFPGRFMIGYLLIVLFFGALLVGFAVLWSERSSDGADGSNWSTFRPTGDSEALRTRQITRFIAARYQTRSGQQLVRVLGGPPAVQDTPVSRFMVRDGTSQQTIGADKALMFILCGTGTDCALPGGDSSAAHARLVRREALELALYSMRFNGVDPVVVLLPPDSTGTPGGAILLRRDDVKTQLDRPLTQSLQTEEPPSAAGLVGLEAATVDFLTLSNLFDYDFQPTQDGTAQMVLNPKRAS
jgi:hypothetical protein